MHPLRAPILSRYSKHREHQGILALQLGVPTIYQSLHQGQQMPHLFVQTRLICP